jgi:hypothetical protein
MVAAADLQQADHLRRDELGSDPPFPIGDRTLFVAYRMRIGCFLAVGGAAGFWICTQVP